MTCGIGLLENDTAGLSTATGEENRLQFLHGVDNIPVVIWKKAALAEFVRKNNCGIVVDSIEDINQMKDLINENDYLEMKRNVMKISKQLRSGYYLLNAVKKIMKCEEN